MYTDKDCKYLQSKKLPLFCKMVMKFSDLGQVGWQLTKNHHLEIFVENGKTYSGALVYSYNTIPASIVFPANWYNTNCKFTFYLPGFCLNGVSFPVCKIMATIFDDQCVEEITKFIKHKTDDVDLSVSIYFRQRLSIPEQTGWCAIIEPYITELIFSNFCFDYTHHSRFIQNSPKLNCIDVRFNSDIMHTIKVSSIFAKIHKPKKIELMRCHYVENDPESQRGLVILLEKIWMDRLYIQSPKTYDLSETLMDVINHHPALDSICFLDERPLNWARIDKKVVLVGHR
jgi:hypothetical protein